MSQTIVLGSSSLEITQDPLVDNPTHLIAKISVKEVKIIKENILRVIYSRENGYDLGLNIDLTDISNQPTWSTGDLAGEKAAVAAFNTWMASAGGGGAGDASAANQITGNASLASIDGKVSTEAKQDTGNTSLNNIDTNIGAKADAVATTDTGTFSLLAFIKRLLAKTPSLGTAVSASSSPVVIASDQATIPVSNASLPLPANASKETGGNLDSIASNTLLTSTNTLISAVNSSTTPLAISGVFTGTGEDVSNYGFISISIFSNVASATNGLSIQQSSDNVNWDITDIYSIPAATGKVFSIARNARYVRIVYTNGGIIQASFRLQVIYTKYGIPASSVRPQDARTNDNDMQEVLAYQMLFNGTTWDRTLKGQQTMVNSQAVVPASDSFSSISPSETGNSTSTLLLATDTFVGTYEDISQYSSVSVWLYSNVASATDGLLIDLSYTIGTGLTKTFTIAASTKREFIFPVTARYFRLRYTNGAVDQGVFQIQVVYHRATVNTSGVRPQDSRSNELHLPEALSFGMVYDPINNVWNRQQTQDLYVTGQSAQTATVNNILTVASGATATDLIGYRSFAVQVVSTGSGGTFIFEGSNDGTNFQAIPVFNQALAIPVPIVTAITASASQLIYVGGSIFRYIRLRIATTITGGNIQAFSKFSQSDLSVTQQIVAQGTAANLNVTALLASITTSVVPGTAATNLGKAEDAVAASGDTGVAVWGVRRDAAVASASATADYSELSVNRFGGLHTIGIRTSCRTYSASHNITIAAAATDIMAIFGNASTIVHVTKIRVSGIATATGIADMILIKRSTANSGGTSSNFSLAAHDATDSANSSTPIGYTANPTPGTSIGNVRRWYQSLLASTSDNAYEYELDLDINKNKPIILSGTSQGLCINLGGATIAGAILNVTIEWIEF